jgi:uroporphyrinogen III methyltransferase / synthase
VAEPDTNALRGKRVVVTRALEQSEALVQALHEAGAEPVVSPMVKFAPPDDLAPLDKALKHARDFDWLLLTSQNAVRALQERCVALDLGIAGIFEGAKIAAVGPASAETARELGLKVVYTASKYQGVALAKELAGKLKGMRVFLPRSDRANPDLVEALIDNGAAVTEVIAYKTELPPGSDLAEIRVQLKLGVDAVLFFSPSAVNHFREVLGQKEFERLAETCGCFAAIGPVTEAALREAGAEQIIVAKSATVPSLLSELARHFVVTPQSISAGAKRG